MKQHRKNGKNTIKRKKRLGNFFTNFEKDTLMHTNITCMNDVKYALNRKFLIDLICQTFLTKIEREDLQEKIFLKRAGFQVSQVTKTVS